MTTKKDLKAKLTANICSVKNLSDGVNPTKIKPIADINVIIIPILLFRIRLLSFFLMFLIFSFIRISTWYRYAYIFYITAVLYVLGIIMYYILVLDYEKRD